MNTTITPKDEIIASISNYQRYERVFLILMKSLGLLGNLLMFIVYCRASLRLSVSVYIRCISIFSTVHILCMIFLYPNWIEIVSNSVFKLKIMNYLQYTILPIVVWFEVAASLDRFVTITFPFKSRFVQKPRLKRFLVSIMIAFNIIIYSDLFNMTIIPFTLMLILSIATFVGILRAHRRFQSLSRHNDVSSRRKLVSRLSSSPKDCIEIDNISSNFCAIFHSLEDIH